MQMGDHDPGFTRRSTASGEVHISRHGRGVGTVLRGAAAQRVPARLTGADERTVQQVPARATGNDNRGNERPRGSIRIRKGVTMSFRNRPARLEDLETLIELMKEFYAESDVPFDDADARRSFVSLIEDPRLGSAWLLAVDEDVAGYFVMTVGFSVGFGGAVVTLDDLFVRPAFRGRGLGRAALGELRNEATSRGVRALHLEVEPENEVAVALYRSVGFRERTLRSMVVLLPSPVDERRAG